MFVTTVGRCGVVGRIHRSFESEHRLFSHHNASAFSKLRSLTKYSRDDSVLINVLTQSCNCNWSIKGRITTIYYLTIHPMKDSWNLIKIYQLSCFFVRFVMPSNRLDIIICYVAAKFAAIPFKDALSGPLIRWVIPTCTPTLYFVWNKTWNETKN